MGCNTSQELKTKKPEDDSAAAGAEAVATDNENDGTTTTDQTTPAVNGDASTVTAAAAANSSSHSPSVEDSFANKSVVPSSTTPLSSPSGTLAKCDSESVNAKNNGSKQQQQRSTAGAYDVANGIHYNGLVNGDIKDDSRTMVKRCEKAEISELNDVGIDEDDEDAEVEADYEDEEDEGKAATKIQAAFRGHKVRADMKKSTDTSAPTTNKNQPAAATDDKSKAAAPAPAAAAADNVDPTKEELEAEFNPNDKELCDAASKIQAAFRGHLSRKIEGNKDDDADDVDIQEITKKVAEELDIDLTDPELNKAATKIQASFRGHKSRQGLPATK